MAPELRRKNTKKIITKTNEYPAINVISKVKQLILSKVRQFNLKNKIKTIQIQCAHINKAYQTFTNCVEKYKSFDGDTQTQTDQSTK